MFNNDDNRVSRERCLLSPHSWPGQLLWRIWTEIDWSCRILLLRLGQLQVRNRDGKLDAQYTACCQEAFQVLTTPPSMDSCKSDMHTIINVDYDGNIVLIFFIHCVHHEMISKFCQGFLGTPIVVSMVDSNPFLRSWIVSKLVETDFF